MKRCAALLVSLALVPLQGFSIESPSRSSAEKTQQIDAQKRNDIATGLRSNAAIAGKFRQTWRDATLPQPLINSGNFVYWRGHGVHWAATSPLEQTTIYRSDATWQIDEGAGSARELRGNRESIFRKTLLDILSFDEAQLAGDFQQQWQFTQEGRWQLSLVPLHGSLARAIAKVEIHGQEYIDGIEIVYTRGGALVLEFQAQHSQSDITDEFCKSLFLYSAQQCQSRLTP